MSTFEMIIELECLLEQRTVRALYSDDKELDMAEVGLRLSLTALLDSLKAKWKDEMKRDKAELQTMKELKELRAWKLIKS